MRLLAKSLIAAAVLVAMPTIASAESNFQTGTGSLTAPLLSMQQAKLSQSGNATSHLQAQQQVDISNSGSGLIKVDGKATCFIRQPGSAKIQCGKTAQP